MILTDGKLIKQITSFLNTRKHLFKNLFNQHIKCIKILHKKILKIIIHTLLTKTKSIGLN